MYSSVITQKWTVKNYELLTEQSFVMESCSGYYCNEKTPDFASSL